MKSRKIHWGGGIGDNSKAKNPARGWPVCCSGYRAELIKAKKHLTENIKEVTCENCLRIVYPSLKDEEKKGIKDMFKNQNGSSNPASKLTWKIVGEIREDYRTGNFTQKQLAEKYKISMSNVGKITRRESWNTL